MAEPISYSGQVSEPIQANRGVRAHNLSRLLQLVHQRGPLSRSALTEATGLNRSTIADLVGHLADEGLVSETAGDRLGRVGRPSPIVAGSADVVAIAANPEIDALELAAIGLDRSIRARARLEFRRIPSAPECVARIAEWTHQHAAELRPIGIGVAVPGLVRAADGLVRVAPHLGWTEAPVREALADASGLPVVVGNDANLGALAEQLYGAARGVDDVVYLNGGPSGIGGALIVHGILVGGASGYAGELGQSRPPVGAGDDLRTRGGVLEDEVSRARLLARAGVRGCDDRTLATLLAATSTAVDEVDRQRRLLAAAIASAVNLLNPRVVVLGGFLSMLAAKDASAFTRLVRSQAMAPSAADIEIRTALLADDRLLVGAAEAAFAQRFW